MGQLMIPKEYKSVLDVKETEQAIKDVRVYFEEALCEALDLSRVSAPLFVRPETGLNDDLNGVERPVSFDLLELKGVICEIVHSLAKWKRFALGKYGFETGKGLYTNMNAIRRDEETDNLHSIYVDQWDWEKVIAKEDRTEATLKQTVEKIYDAIKKTEDFVCMRHPLLKKFLPEKITFVTAQELEDAYPDLTSLERESLFAKKYGAIFVAGIGGALKSGKPHDGRAPDYDDWTLNGDIIVYYPPLERAFEISSMGIRVDKAAMEKQLEITGKSERLQFPFHKSVVDETIPFTIGGGIGQSRLCMLLLQKAHIGEVQCSIWPEEMEAECGKNGIYLL